MFCHTFVPPNRPSQSATSVPWAEGVVTRAHREEQGSLVPPGLVGCRLQHTSISEEPLGLVSGVWGPGGPGAGASLGPSVSELCGMLGRAHPVTSAGLGQSGGGELSASQNFSPEVLIKMTSPALHRSAFVPVRAPGRTPEKQLSHPGWRHRVSVTCCGYQGSEREAGWHPEARSPQTFKKTITCVSEPAIS